MGNTGTIAMVAKAPYGKAPTIPVREPVRSG